MGKSSLLEEVAARAVDFSVLRTECLPFRGPQAFATVQQLGVEIDQSTGGGALAVSLAAQRTRALIDERLAEGPLLVMVDDVQWADAESLEVLLAVMSRAEAERLLLVVASRPLGPEQHPTFQRWQSQVRSTQQIVLNGLGSPGRDRPAPFDATGNDPRRCGNALGSHGR